MSVGSDIDLFADSESCGQPPSFSLTSLTLGGSQLFAHGIVPGTARTRGNLDIILGEKKKNLFLEIMRLRAFQFAEKNKRKKYELRNTKIR